LTVDKLKIDETIDDGFSKWIITDVLGDGKFRAIRKDSLIEEYNYRNSIEEGGDGSTFADLSEKAKKEYIDDGSSVYSEQFDISGKVDTNNPIYKFYEKDMGKYLQSKYNAKIIEDSKGVKWYEVDVPKEAADRPVDAFGLIKANPLTIGAGVFAGALGATRMNGKPVMPNEIKKNDVDVPKLVETIKYNESRGEKNPYGFSQFSGIKKLGKALGAYQITEGELATYAKRYLGKTVTAKEFLANPKLQDEYIKNKVESLAKRGLTVEEILAAHRVGASDLTDEGLAKIKKQAEAYIASGMTVYKND
jgi:hypothetical protein